MRNFFSPRIVCHRGKGVIISPYDDYAHGFVRTIQCDGDDVCYALKDQYQNWIPARPIFIDAPTGSHKSTFARKYLIPDAIKRKKNVLILGNRVALTTQTKLEVMKIIDWPKKNYYTPEGLRAEDDFGSIKIMTYQSLHGFVNNSANKEWIRNTLYVIADEVHFLTSDSLFNPYCDLCLDTLVENFYHAIRIYMTATSWNVINPLAQRESIAASNSRPRTFEDDPIYLKRYYFPPSYKHVNLNFFDSMEEIQEKIESDPDKKWLIFMDNKENGKQFSECLGSNAVYLDSSLKGSPEWVKLIELTKFEQQVMVTTAVLDCGININDPKLQNIVIITDDRTSLIQMMGRKRRKQGEKINLFIQNMSPQKMNRRKLDAEQAMSMFENLESFKDTNNTEAEYKMMSEIWASKNDSHRIYFSLFHGRLYPNNQARYAIGRKLKLYKSLVNPVADFQAIVRYWLDKKQPETDKLTTLIKYCEEMEGLELDGINVSEFRRLLKAALISSGKTEPHDMDRIDTMAYNAINNRLRALKIGYSLSKEMKITKSEQNLNS